MNEKAFENIVGKAENAGNQHFLLFPQCFLPFPKQVLFFIFKFIMSANAFNLDRSKILSFNKVLTLSQTCPWFYVCSTSLLKNSLGKGEIARTKQFLFFPQHFLPIQINLHHFRQT